MMDERPWNTARCSRLLRPLTNNLASLESEQRSRAREIQTSQVSNLNHEEDLVKGTVSDDISSKVNSKRNNPDDLDWEQFGPRKRLKRVYSKRGAVLWTVVSEDESEKHSTTGHWEPGEISLSTPLMKTIRSHVKTKDSIPFQQQLGQKLGNTGYNNRKAPESSKNRNRRMTPIEAVENSFSALLRQTKADICACDSTERPNSSGVLSLFTLCLQNIPAYITDEQSWRKEQDSEDKSDVSAETYEFLESLECGGSHGWKPLREVVRAQGLSMIQNAIKNKTLATSHIKSLVDLCIQQDATAEAKRLVQSWIDAHAKFPNPSTPKAKSCELQNMINKVTSKSKSSAFQWRVLTKVLGSGKLPLEWITTTAFNNTWHTVVQSVSQHRGDSQDAESLITLILLLASHRTKKLISEKPTEDTQFPFDIPAPADPIEGPHLLSSYSDHIKLPVKFQQAIANTVSSFCVILSAVGQIERQFESENMGKTTHVDCMRSIQRASTCLRNLDSNSSKTADSHVIGSRMIICGADALFALHNAHDSREIAQENLDNSIAHLLLLRDSYDRVPDKDSTSSEILSQFICSVARIHERAEADTGFDFLKRMVTDMLDYRPPHNTGQELMKLTFIRRLALDSLMNFNEASTNPEHIQLVHAAEKFLGVMPAKCRTEKSNNNSQTHRIAALDGLRWEQGICEWVAATPAAMLQMKTFSNPVAPLDQFSPLKKFVVPKTIVTNSPSKETSRGLSISTSVFDEPSSPVIPQESLGAVTGFDLENEEVFDSGIWTASTHGKEAPQKQVCGIPSYTTVHDKENELIQWIDSDAEDELGIGDSFEDYPSSLGVELELPELKRGASRFQTRKHEEQQLLYACTFTSDELG